MLAVIHVRRKFDLAKNDGEHVRRLRDIETIVIHRSLWTPGAEEYQTHGLDDTAESVARYFTEPRFGAGGCVGWRVPYDIVIDPRGTISQIRPLTQYGAHAKGCNSTSIGIACIGNFIFLPPTMEQRRTLEDLCAGLLRWQQLDVQGHTDIPDATDDPSKICPGVLLDVASVRGRVQAINETVGGVWLLDAGVGF